MTFPGKTSGFRGKGLISDNAGTELLKRIIRCCVDKSVFTISVLEKDMNFAVDQLFVNRKQVAGPESGSEIRSLCITLAEESVKTGETVKGMCGDSLAVMSRPLLYKQDTVGAVIIGWDPDSAGDKCAKNILEDSAVLQLEILSSIIEESLKENSTISSSGKYKELYNEIVENPDILIWQIDMDGKYTYLNPAWELLMGYRADEMMGRPFTDFLPDGYTETNTSVFYDIMNGEHLKDYKTVHIGKGGNIVNISFSGKRVLNEKNEVTGARGIARDITPIENALNQYRMLFEEMIDGFALHEVIVDDKGKPVDYRFLDINPSFERLTGLTRGILGKTVLEAMPETESYWIEKYGNVALTGEPVTFENYSKELDKHFEVTAYRPGPGQFAVIFTDITDRKKTSEKLSNAQRLESLGILAGGIAHDFNNLLSGILGNIDLANQFIEESSSAKKYIRNALNSFDRAKNLTRQLLTFSKGGKPEMSITDLKSIIDESAELAFSGSNMIIEKNINRDIENVMADENQMHQVFSNIFINAMQAMPDGGAVTINCANFVLNEGSLESVPELIPGNYVKVSIKDQGAGIPKNNIARIFDPFFTTKKTGSGLGLATSYSIMKRHGGTIQVESGPGEGTTVTVYVPSCGKSTVDEKENNPVLNSKFKGKVMVMDDEDFICELASEMLSSLGFEVICTFSGDEAVRTFRESRNSGTPFDLVLLDLTIPGESGGEEVMKKLLEIDPDVKGIVSSGYSNSPVLSEPEKFGFAEKIEKPYNLENVKSVLSKIYRM